MSFETFECIACKSGGFLREIVHIENHPDYKNREYDLVPNVVWYIGAKEGTIDVKEIFEGKNNILNVAERYRCVNCYDYHHKLLARFYKTYPDQNHVNFVKKEIGDRRTNLL